MELQARRPSLAKGTGSDDDHKATSPSSVVVALQYKDSSILPSPESATSDQGLFASGNDVQPSPALSTGSRFAPGRPSAELLDDEQDGAGGLRRPSKTKKDLAFFLVVSSLCVSSFLSAMDLTAVSTAIPTMIHDLHGGGASAFVWIGSAFALSGTAVLPWIGGLANIFGRKGLMLISLVLFGAGSVICGAARDMPMLIAGRAVQGLGDAGIIALSEIIIADLVPLSERGTWEGVLGVVWAIASFVGPPLGGALTEFSTWRWIFWMNVPLCALAFALVSFFMKMKRPATSFRSKMEQMDWWGNLIVVGAVVALTIATSLGGVEAPWSSASIVTPLVFGFLGLVGFFLYELTWAKVPTVPKEVVSNRTSVLTFVAVFVHGLIALCVVYVLPTYFQACLGASASESGVKLMPTAFVIAPSAMIAAVSIEMTGFYRAQNWLGWVLTIVGLGLFTMLDEHSSKAFWVCVQLPLAAGLGINFAAPQFPALAPLHPRFAAQALALFTFISSLGQTFGTVVGESILQNKLQILLPPSLLASLSANATIARGGSSSSSSTTDLAIAAIPLIPSLPAEVGAQVRRAFAESCRDVWVACLPLAALGLLTCLGLKVYPLAEDTDEEFAMEDR